ncbi:MAG: DUF1638 domain-containing protein [Fimbriimonadaceae bacterium]|nr:DUF1638 domain-containing protein [Fimbriimonadaceae bacterium]
MSPGSLPPPKRVLIFCRVMEDEVRAVVAGLPCPPILRPMPQGLHNDPAELRSELQKAVDLAESEESPDEILLGYGLCSRGIEGVRTRRARLIIPKTHDCIALLLGSRKRHREQIAQNPATYWYSVGWNRHHVPPGPKRHRGLKERYTELYGEDNAEYLMESETAWMQEYDRAAFIDTGVGPVEAEAEHTRSCAEWLGWRYDRLAGSLEMIARLLRGKWSSEEFLVLQPGQTARMTADDEVIRPAD